MIQLSKMPPPPNHNACSTPNPPWWCGEQQDVMINDGLWILLVVGLIIGIVYILIKEKE